MGDLPGMAVGVGEVARGPAPVHDGGRLEQPAAGRDGRVEGRCDLVGGVDVDRQGDAAERRPGLRRERRILRQLVPREQADVRVRRPEPGDLIARRARSAPSRAPRRTRPSERGRRRPRVTMPSGPGWSSKGPPRERLEAVERLGQVGPAEARAGSGCRGWPNCEPGRSRTPSASTSSAAQSSIRTPGHGQPREADRARPRADPGEAVGPVLEERVERARGWRR